jgi:hypothetical protein
MSTNNLEAQNSPAQPVIRPTRAAWRIEEWAEAVGLSRMSVYNLFYKGHIQSVKSGKARLIITSPADYIASLPRV